MEENPIIGVARDLQPLIREHTEAGEERARLMPGVVKAAGEAGLFRLYAPREVGGLEVLPSVLLAAEEVEESDSALWAGLRIRSTTLRPNG